MDCSLFSTICRILGEKSSMWHIIQVLSLEKFENQHIVGKLHPFSLDPLEFNKTYGIRKRTN